MMWTKMIWNKLKLTKVEIICKFHISPGRSNYWPQEKFREIMTEKAKHAKQTTQFLLYVNYAAFVAMVPLTVWVVRKEMAHSKHPRPEFINYDHLYGNMKKKYPWGDGKHSYFHNPVRNALPDIGYEVPDPNAGHGAGGGGGHGKKVCAPAKPKAPSASGGKVDEKKKKPVAAH